MACKGVEGYAENFAARCVKEQQRLLIKKLLQRGIGSVEEIANISCASVDLVKEVQMEMEKDEERGKDS